MVSDDKDDGQSSDHSAIPSASVHSDHPGSETGSGAHQPSTNPHHPHGADGAQPSTATGPAESGGAGHHGAPAAPGAPGSSGSHGNGAEGSVDKSKIQVTVLNNSRIQGLAEKVTKHLSADHWSNTSFGNLPGDGGAAFPDSVVLYDDNVESKAAATEVATTLGLKAQPKTDQTNQQLTNAKMLSGQHPGSVIVVTTADMNP